MSNLVTEKEYDNFKDLLDFVFQQQMKAVYTCLPGIVDQYESSTKRAIVSVAINKLLTDNSTESYPTLADVPVIFPSGGGFGINFPLGKGDSVLLLFSQRSIENFKKTFASSDVGSVGFFSIKDAVAIPGFGSLTQTPATESALNLQTENAAHFISITQTGIILTSPTVTINGDLVVNGAVSATGDMGGGAISLQDHVHGGVMSGGSDTGEAK